MRIRNKLVLIVLIVIGSFYLFGTSLENTMAEQKQLIFEKDTRYDIYYALEDQVQCVSNVKIMDTTVIGGVTFLEIRCPGVAADIDGYVALPSVKVILPTGSPKPQNI